MSQSNPVPRLWSIRRITLETLGLKEIDGSCIVHCQDSEYKQVLARKYQTGEAEVLQLYQVTFEDHVTKYVLAESEAGAVGQASCQNGLQIVDREAYEKTAIVTRLPMRIRGWGSTEF